VKIRTVRVKSVLDVRKFGISLLFHGSGTSLLIYFGVWTLGWHIYKADTHKKPVGIERAPIEKPPER